MSSTTAPKSQPARPHGDDYIPAPDRSKFLSEMDSLRKELSGLRAEITKQKASIEKQKASGAQSPEEQKLRDSHTSTLGELKQLRESERKINAEAAKIDDSIKQKVQQLQLLRPKSGPRTIKELDSQIERLEQAVGSGALSLVEESKTLKEAGHLKKQRVSFNEASRLQAEVDEVRAKSAALRKQFDTAALKSVMSRKQELEKKLDGFKAERKDRKGAMDKLYDELRSLQGKSKEITQKLDKKRASFDAEQNEFSAKLKARKQAREDEEKKEKEQQAKAKKVDAARSKLAAAREPAFQSHIDSAKKLLAHLDPRESKFVQETKSEAEAAAAASPAASASDALNLRKSAKPAATNTATASATSSAADAAPPSRKSLKQKKQQDKKQDGKAGEPKLQFDFTLVEALSSLNIALPTTPEEVEETKAKLQEKIRYYEENNQRVTEEKVQRAEAELEAALKESE